MTVFQMTVCLGRDVLPCLTKESAHTEKPERLTSYTDSLFNIHLLHIITAAFNPRLNPFDNISMKINVEVAESHRFLKTFSEQNHNTIQINVIVICSNNSVLSTCFIM